MTAGAEAASDSAPIVAVRTSVGPSALKSISKSPTVAAAGTCSAPVTRCGVPAASKYTALWGLTAGKAWRDMTTGRLSGMSGGILKQETFRFVPAAPKIARQLDICELLRRGIVMILLDVRRFVS